MRSRAGSRASSWSAAPTTAGDVRVHVEVAVADLEAGWSYQGSWALLRMMRAHFSRQRPPNVDYTEFPLVLQLPVYAPYSPENEARFCHTRRDATRGDERRRRRGPNDPLVGRSRSSIRRKPKCGWMIIIGSSKRNARQSAIA